MPKLARGVTWPGAPQTRMKRKGLGQITCTTTSGVLPTSQRPAGNEARLEAEKVLWLAAPLVVQGACSCKASASCLCMM